MKNLPKMLVVGMIVLAVSGCSNNEGKKNESQFKTNNSSAAISADFTSDYVIEATDVAARKDDVVLVDCRGEETAKKGTIEGAAAVSWQYLSNVEDVDQGEYEWGLVYEAPELAKRLGKAGLSKEANLVLFSDGVEGWGEDGRILWTLNQAGYEQVKLVNGGMQALKEAGLPTSKKITTLESVNVEIESLDKGQSIDTTELEADFTDYKLVDVRSKKEYDGATKFGEAKGGHLPKAIHFAYTDLFQENGYLKSNEAIAELAEAAGLAKEDALVTYCTGGIRSAYMAVILSSIGYNQVKNYDGSYYTWSANNKVEK
ncbi:sulfurtransferase [Vagococcus sp. BWB3-3]|uniref:thiosulfate sulfurtransferase n=1 Tax=Vagococcus allomyrinae TaxID=2794353 RepID=A0A940P6X2_9ENTE|nr:rhodanese-like domain-containing protein [Vagococcus allomyrinae]MBP1042185.1 sulfurtransferase [Vagococcus allomyrinae]